MPELPEVETVVVELRSQCLERRLSAAQLQRQDILKRPQGSTDEFAKFFVDHSFKSIERAGKYIIFTLDNNDRLLAHLGMTGKFVVSTNGAEQPDHLCSQYVFADGGRLDHVDVRRFGRLELYRSGKPIDRLDRLGIDPLSDVFNSDSLKTLVYSRNGRSRRQRAVHTLLLDQSLVSGVGNIYASEALFRAGIRPSRAGGKLKPADLERLCEGLCGVMQDALKYGGTTVNDFRRVDDKPGSFKDMLCVYGRTDESCRACGTKIKKIRLGGRSVYFCPKCQPR